MKAQGRKLRAIDNRNGLLFALPWLISLCAFCLYPFVASLYYSLCDYNGTTELLWVGLGNYQAMFKDELFAVSLYNTVYYVAFYIPFSTVWAIILALLLNLPVRGQSVYRTLYYIPSIVPAVGSSILWSWILNPLYGIVNSALAALGIDGPGWLANPLWSKPALILMGLWGVGGAVVIYLAGLQGVPQSLYEAADIDGATSWSKVIHITLPMLSPVILFNVIMGLIGGFQYFTQAYVMTGGGPVNSTLFYSLYIYRCAFNYFKMGYASALAWLLFLIVMSCTVLVFKSSARVVYYGGER